MKKLICLMIFVAIFSFSLTTAYSRGEGKIGDKSLNNKIEAVQTGLEKDREQGTELKVLPGPTDADGKKYTMRFIQGKDIDKGIFIDPIISEGKIIAELQKAREEEKVKNEKIKNDKVKNQKVKNEKDKK